jgi:trans-aconitate methyltransferase
MFANAEAYERFMGRWSRFVAPRLIDFAGSQDRSRILDIGSGTGSLTFALAERYAQAADSEGCRSAFRTDVDHCSEVMPINVPN